MSSSNNQPNIPINPYNGDDIVKNLFNITVPLNVHGIVYNELCSVLEDKIVEMFNNVGMKELDRILIYPEFEERSGDVTNIRCYAYFDTNMPGASHITKIGGNKNNKTNRNNRNNGEKISMLDYVPGYTSKGKYEIDDEFVKNFLPVAADVSNNELKIQETENDDVAVLELDFMSVTALYLQIGNDDPYDFTIINVIRNNRRQNNYDDALIIIMKYIDTGRLGRNKKKKNGRRIDYRRLEQETINNINRKRR